MENRPTEQIYPLGTLFEKEFPGYGTFVGEIKSFDGVYYHVYYQYDGDEEDLSESQLDSLKMLTPVPKRVRKERETGTVPAETNLTSARQEKRRAETPTTPRYTVGTKFAKIFAGFGTFVGQVEAFDGTYYKVYYPSDGDREDLTEEELDQLTILEQGKAQSDSFMGRLKSSTDTAPEEKGGVEELAILDRVPDAV